MAGVIPTKTNRAPFLAEENRKQPHRGRYMRIIIRKNWKIKLFVSLRLFVLLWFKAIRRGVSKSLHRSMSLALHCVRTTTGWNISHKSVTQILHSVITLITKAGYFSILTACHSEWAGLLVQRIQLQVHRTRQRQRDPANRAHNSF